MSEVNYVLDRSNLEVRMIDRTIPKVENASEHKYVQQYERSKQYDQKRYDQRYNQSNTIKSDTISNTVRAIKAI